MKLNDSLHQKALTEIIKSYFGYEGPSINKANEVLKDKQEQSARSVLQRLVNDCSTLVEALADEPVSKKGPKEQEQLYWDLFYKLQSDTILSLCKISGLSETTAKQVLQEAFRKNSN